MSKKSSILPALQAAASHFVGEHDFTAFSNAKSKTKSMVRQIYSIHIEKDAGLITIRIRGNGFLHNMARRIVGILIQVGLSNEQAQNIPAILEARQRNQIAMVADAGGLFLEKVRVLRCIILYSELISYPLPLIGE